MVCGACGRESPAGNWFCGVCGVALPHRLLNTLGAQGTMGLARAPLQNPRPEEPTPAGDGATEDATRSSTEDLRDRPPNQLDNETTTDETTPLHHELLDIAHPPAAVPPGPIAVQAPDFPWLDDVLEQIDLELARSSKGKKPTQILDLHKDSSPPVRGSDTHTSTAITKSPEIPVVQNAGGSDNKGRKEQSAGGSKARYVGPQPSSRSRSFRN